MRYRDQSRCSVDGSHPVTGEWHRTFCVITCPVNELMSEIHDRMPVIVAPINYDHWLSGIEPDPRDLFTPFPSEPMHMWPILDP